MEDTDTLLALDELKLELFELDELFELNEETEELELFRLDEEIEAVELFELEEEKRAELELFKLEDELEAATLNMLDFELDETHELLDEATENADIAADDALDIIEPALTAVELDCRTPTLLVDELLATEDLLLPGIFSLKEEREAEATAT